VVLGEAIANPFTAFNSVLPIIQALVQIALLVYVLFRQGRNLRQLGLTAERADVLPTLLLTAVGFLPTYLFILYFWSAQAGMEVFPSFAAMSKALQLGPIAWASLLLAAAAEELILRAYLITEVVDLTGGVVLAVLASSCFQGLYHLFQGQTGALVATASFLISSIYYVKTRRITPVILSHFFYNLLVFGDLRLH
jgi:membrane protease YdiL (CAAX protease family)